MSTCIHERWLGTTRSLILEILVQGLFDGSLYSDNRSMYMTCGQSCKAAQYVCCQV